MSSTRHASEDAPFSQERYASSAVYEPGLLGNLVARRAKAITGVESRALVYFLQQLSHRDGGLQRVADEILAMFPERLGTRAMRQIGKLPGQTFTAKEEEMVRACEPRRPLSASDFLPPPRPRHKYDEDGFVCGYVDDEVKDAKEAAPPYSVNSALEKVRHAALELPELLKRICLDPKIKLDDSQNPFSVWWFEDLLSALHLYRKSHSEAAEQRIAKTTISNRIFDDLDFCHLKRAFVIIEGEQRTGKSTAAEAWCAMHPGQAIYISLESGKDIFTFFRTIARAIGTASSGQMKANEMRMRVEDMLQERHLTIVLDEGHYLFPLVARPKSAPDRVDWLRTALIDHGVAVALVATPQFDRQCAHFEKCIQWNAKQIKGRIKLQTLLPAELPVEDLEAVARKMAPYADEVSLTRLVGYAEGSDDYLAGIERLTCRADFFAVRDGRATAGAADIKRALDEALSAVPVAAPLAPAPASKRRGSAVGLPAPRRAKRFGNFSPVALTRRPSMDTPASQDAGFEASGRLQFTELSASE